MHMLSSYRPVNGKTALLNKRTRAITLKRRFQTKEREQLLCNGVTKQKNASNYFATALLNKRTRAITLKRRCYGEPYSRTTGSLANTSSPAAASWPLRRASMTAD